MFLSKITIKNFRLFKCFKLTLNKGLNLIVGENNSGKTALIDAIRYTLDTNSAEWIRVSEDDFHKNQTHFSIQLKFEDITPTQASVFVEHLTHEKVTDDKRKSVLYVNFEAHLTDRTQRGTRFIRTEIRSGQNADGPAIEREIRNYLSTTYLKPLRDAEAELASGRGSRLSQILFTARELTSDTSNLDELITALLEANKKIIGNPGIDQSRENVKNQLKKLIFITDNFEPAIDIVGNKEIAEMSELEKERSFREILEKLSLWLDQENRLQGLGYNNLLFIATELLLLEQETDDFPLLLIEEPEAHLHPQLQMKLLKFIRGEFSQAENPKLQSILTTHSPNFASKAPLESLIIMAKGQAFSLRKDETQLEDDDYVFLEKFLDVTKSNLFFAKAVLIVEGDGENILLPTIAELLGYPLEDYGVAVVNVGNTAYARYAKIFKRKKAECIPTRVACLRDLDLWPDKAEDTHQCGFKERKDRNKHFWLNYYDAEKLDAYKKVRKSIQGQNVRVYLSDVWTFEYSLALNGLAAEVYEAVHGCDEGFDQLPSDEEEKAICIYKRIETEKAKTRVAYELAEILREKYQDKREELKNKLPEYIINAIKYVTQEAVAP